MNHEKDPRRVLIVDDLPSNLNLLRASLEPLGYDLLAATNGELALQIAASVRPDLILLDVVMPGMDGFEVCRRLKADPATSAIPILFVTAQHEITCLVDAFRVGAVDYLTKPFQTEEVRARVATHLSLAALRAQLEIQNQQLTASNEELRREISRREAAEVAARAADAKLTDLTQREAARWGVEGLISCSPAMDRLREQIRKLQPLKTSVLITGESGTGKELIARALHFGGQRAREPFVAVNCAAIPPELAESQLFGHAKGAFSGATGDHPGYFEQAHGGTLFLDEIGEMPAAQQAKLLRVLETNVIQRLGDRKERVIDVRVVAATNVVLQSAVNGGRFRSDLFHRLARFVLVIPPLRERPEDIPMLAAHFARQFSAEMGKNPVRINASATEILLRHPLPGNVRQLRNLIERALIEANGPEILPKDFGTNAAEGTRQQTETPSPDPNPDGLPWNLEALERLWIERALRECGANISKAAELLGVNRSRIYKWQTTGDT